MSNGRGTAYRAEQYRLSKLSTIKNSHALIHSHLFADLQKIKTKNNEIFKIIFYLCKRNIGNFTQWTE